MCENAYTTLYPPTIRSNQANSQTPTSSFLLAAIQVLTAIFLGLILIALLALIITVSPDLEYERKALVTPVVKSLAYSIMQYGRSVEVGVLIVVLGVVVGAGGGWYVTRESEVVEVKVEGGEGEGGDGE